MEEFAVGIVGTGAFASTHAEALARRRDSRVAGFLGRHRGADDELAARFGAQSWRSVADLAREADLAVIATPHDNHAELACQLLEAGVDVLVEKPIARSAAEADRIITAAAGSGAICVVGHLMRYAPAHRMAREWIADGRIGQPVLASSRRLIVWDPAMRRDWHKRSASGGGMWLIQGVHVVDQLSWLLDARATSAFGVADRVFQDPAEQDADDLGLAILDFPGVRAQLAIAGLRQGADSVLTEIHGADGAIRVSHRGMLAIDRGDGWEAHRFHPSTDHGKATLDAEWDDVIAGLRARRASVDAEYGRYVVAVVDAIRRSQESGSRTDVE